MVERKLRDPIGKIGENIRSLRVRRTRVAVDLLVTREDQIVDAVGEQIVAFSQAYESFVEVQHGMFVFFLLRHVDANVVRIHSDPCLLSRTEAGIERVVPLHWSPGVVTASDVDDLHDFVVFDAFG